MKKLLLLCGLPIIFVQGGDAQTTVTTAEALFNAVETDRANIVLGADIEIGRYLGIANGKTVILDLNSHTLTRTGATNDTRNGHVIFVDQSGNLTLKATNGGVITGGCAINGGGVNNWGTLTIEGVTIMGCKTVTNDDGGEGRGGGIFNKTGATLTITEGIVTNNEAVGNAHGGAGIFNDGSMVIIDASVTNNSAVNTGGGIKNYGIMSITGGCISNNNAASGGGIWNGGTLNLADCTIMDCKTEFGNDDRGRGAGIFNERDATLTITGGVISKNVGFSAGGVFNYGTMTLEGGDIEYNESTRYGGGGIANHGTLTIKGGTLTGNSAPDGGGVFNGGTLAMEGSVKITGNENNHMMGDLYLAEGKVINVSGAFTNDARISVYMKTPGVFTSGYRAHNNKTNHFFTETCYDVALNDAGEACLYLDKHNYVECSWDEMKERVVYTIRKVPNLLKVENLCDPKFANGGHLWGDSCFYMVDGKATINNKLYCHGNVHIILVDNAQLTLQHGLAVNVPDKATLFIHCQSYESLMGKLIVNTDDHDAGIGSTYNKPVGFIIIHGGDICSTGGSGAAGIGGGFNAHGASVFIYDGKVETHGGQRGPGIGGGEYANGGKVTIYGGEVYAHGGDCAAGIGCGWEQSDALGNLTFAINGGTIVVNGGSVHAYGGDSGAGVGGGLDASGGSVTITGGNVYAYGGNFGAGIGFGNHNDHDSSFDHTCFIDITGGNVYAYGGKLAAGIGGGQDFSGGNITISGGMVYAKGGSDAAGIGCGEESINAHDIDGGTITITGGKVEAYGGNYGAGIGGGQDGGGGTITINGGEVYAKGGSDAAGIGSGEETNLRPNIDGGTITITGGKVEAYGGQFGAGIGGGQDADGGVISISGGKVYAYGGDDAAGIGSGEETTFSSNIDGGTITITGGYVEAYGNDEGAGIGAGQDAARGDVTIRGGTVLAGGGGNTKAIITHDSSDGANSFVIGDKMMVSAGASVNELSKVRAENGDRRAVSVTKNRYARMEPCTHDDGVCTISDGSLHQVTSCDYCLSGGSMETHVFGNDSKCVCGLLGLMDNTDNTQSLVKWNNTTQTVALVSRTLRKDDKWNTLCLPFSLGNFDGTPLKGASVKTLHGSEFDTTSLTLTLNFCDATSIEAGKPYIVKWTDGEDVENPVFKDVIISDSTADVETDAVDFIGLFSPLTIDGASSGMLFLGDDNKLYHPSLAMQINAFRAYFLLHKGLVADGSHGSSVRASRK